ncbi:MAG TPA: protein kinase [Blastocatellia bacterium]|nr:protein kinase [Blastocatellia bacterium]
MIGKVVGTYKIIDKIGEGGMGSVYKGIDEMLEREVAIKVLRPELASQERVVERFRTEAKTLAKLNHTNIATVFNFIHQDEHYFMVMEYVRGETFDHIIRRTGAMLFEQAVAMFCHALDGLEHAHSLGIIHRDIKPANIMLSDTGIVKVMDFGIARVLGTSRMTKQGNIIGTIEYMSPEQVRGEETDARSDIYAAGILLYEMLTGRVPFESKSEFELMKAQIEEPPPPPRTFASYISDQAEEAIMRALAKKPEARYQSAKEFRQELLKSVATSTAPLGDSAPAYAAPATRVSSPIENPALAESVSKDTRPDEDMYLDRETIITAPRQAEPKQSAPALAIKPGEPVKPAVDEAAPFADSAAEALEEGAEERVKERVRQVIPLEAEPKAAGMFGKLNWKHYTAIAVVLLALVGGSLALVNRDKGEAAQPAATTPAAATDQNAAQPADQAAPPPQQNTQPPTKTQSNTSGKEPRKARNKQEDKNQKKSKAEKVVETGEKIIDTVKKAIPKRRRSGN